nr:MAG TPA: hypothetical protein [Caudoviricetes sp.]
MSHKERLISGFIVSGTAVWQNFGEEKNYVELALLPPQLLTSHFV